MMVIILDVILNDIFQHLYLLFNFQLPIKNNQKFSRYNFYIYIIQTITQNQAFIFILLSDLKMNLKINQIEEKLIVLGIMLFKRFLKNKVLLYQFYFFQHYLSSLFIKEFSQKKPELNGVKKAFSET
ncbi:hypothetical protein pb186bvf_000868 [Paramecium bursaria]